MPYSASAPIEDQIDEDLRRRRTAYGAYKVDATLSRVAAARAAEATLTVDGETSPDGTVALVDDGARHRVVLAAARRSHEE